MRILALSLTLISLWSCSKNSFQSAINEPGNFSDNSSNDANSVPPILNEPVDPNAYKPVPLEWEASVSGSSQWSKYIFNYIKTEQPQMMGANVADDVETFCPKYRTLSEDQRVNFWGQLIAGMAKYESAWKPTSRMVESTMGTDPVTGRQVASEGLLQLSYQDQGNYDFDCGFDWSIDRNYSDSDARKTIFNPYKNLKCGIYILSRQLTRKRAITLTSGVYWAVLKKGGTYTKIPQISTITKKLAFCN
jgi:hypothetical protein